MWQTLKEGPMGSVQGQRRIRWLTHKFDCSWSQKYTLEYYEASFIQVRFVRDLVCKQNSNNYWAPSSYKSDVPIPHLLQAKVDICLRTGYEVWGRNSNWHVKETNKLAKNNRLIDSKTIALWALPVWSRQTLRCVLSRYEHTSNLQKGLTSSSSGTGFVWNKMEHSNINQAERQFFGTERGRHSKGQEALAWIGCWNDNHS